MFEHGDVRTNLRLYASFHGRSWNDAGFRGFLETVNLDVPLDQPVGTLSGGEKQRLAIACCLSKDTDVILLDEPTAFLDENNERQVFRAIQQASLRHHKTVVIASHSPLCDDIADEIYEIKDRKLHNPRHCEEKTQMTLDCSQHIGLSFCLSYAKYFISRYMGMEACCAMILAVSLFLVCLVSSFLDIGAAKSIRSYESMCDNQIFVTKVQEQTTIDGSLIPFAFNDPDAIPYIPTFAMIDDMMFVVVPKFDNNNFDDEIIVQYRDTGAWLSHAAFVMLEEAHVNEGRVDIQVFQPGEEESVVSKAAGVLSDRHRCLYFENPDIPYVYVDAEILQTLYVANDSLGAKEYLGYTVFADSYEEYKQRATSLSQDHGVNMLFPFIDEIDALIRLSLRTRWICNIIGCAIIIGILCIMEYVLFTRRGMEMLLLKANGASNKWLFTICMLDMLARDVAGLVVSSSLTTLSGAALHVHAFPYIGETCVYLGVVLGAMSIVQVIFIKGISVEKILRGRGEEYA